MPRLKEIIFGMFKIKWKITKLKKKMALPVAHNAPIKEMNKFNLGTNSAITTEIENKN